MLTHPTEQRLVALGLAGMAKALEDQRRQPDVAALSFEERLGLLVDREAIERENKRLVSRLKFAGLRQNAVVENIDMKAARGLDKPLLAKLIAHGEDRAQAIDRLAQALAATQVQGPATNLALLRRLLAHPAFVAGRTHTSFLAEHRTSLLAEAG